MSANMKKLMESKKQIDLWLLECERKLYELEGCEAIRHSIYATQFIGFLCPCPCALLQMYIYKNFPPMLYEDGTR